jgi:hypothetical protein
LFGRRIVTILPPSATAWLYAYPHFESLRLYAMPEIGTTQSDDDRLLKSES